MFGTVVRTERLTPHMVRVVLGGEGLDGFAEPAGADAYVNCFFLPAGAAYSPPFDADEVRGLPRDQRPYPRRMTVRRWDAARGELELDIAVHGEVGYAGQWALAAEAGDRLQVRGPAGDFTPPATVDGHLLVGDESAWPAIAACAEAVPAGAPVWAVVEVDTAADELPLASPGDLSVTWLHRDGVADPTSLMVEAVRALDLPAGRLSAFVHGEADSIREVRRHLLTNRLVDPADLSCSPYWRRGHDDEQWRSVKGEWVKRMNADV